MAENKKEIELEEDEILRVSVTKKHPGAKEYEYYILSDCGDEDAERISEIFEEVLDKKLDYSLVPVLISKAIEAGIDVSFMFPADKS